MVQEGGARIPAAKTRQGSPRAAYYTPFCAVLQIIKHQGEITREYKGLLEITRDY